MLCLNCLLIHILQVIIKKNYNEVVEMEENQKITAFGWLSGIHNNKEVKIQSKNTEIARVFIKKIGKPDKEKLKGIHATNIAYYNDKYYYVLAFDANTKNQTWTVTTRNVVEKINELELTLAFILIRDSGNSEDSKVWIVKNCHMSDILKGKDLKKDSYKLVAEKDIMNVGTDLNININKIEEENIKQILNNFWEENNDG